MFLVWNSALAVGVKVVLVAILLISGEVVVVVTVAETQVCYIVQVSLQLTAILLPPLSQ